MTSQEPKSEEDIDWAYQTIEAFTKGFNKVQSEPVLIDAVVNELLTHFPSLLEAMTIITAHEHKMVVYNLLKSYVGVVKAWVKRK